MAEHKQATSGSSGGPLRCVVVTPESTILDRTVEFVVLPLYDGEIGIGRGHSPLIGRLGYGEMRLRNASGQSDRYYVGGGFVQVAGNVVSVLTEGAILASELDPGVAAENLRAAHQKRADNEVAFDERERLELQARAQLRLARRA